MQTDGTTLKSVQMLLMTFFCSIIIVALLIVGLFETDIINMIISDPPIEGLLAGMPTLEFWLTTAMELLTIVLIPLSLRLFKWERVTTQLINQQAPALQKWGVIRLTMLEFVVISNTLLYYLTLNVSFGYMAIIGALCLPFVTPTIGRCMAEIGYTDNKQTETPEEKQ